MLVTGLGRLTKDVNVQVGSNGTTYVTFDLAYKNKTKDTDGNYTTSFITCKAFKGTGELIAKLCKKGTQVFIIGDLVQRSYKNKEDKTVSTFEIIISEFNVCESKKVEEAPKQEETPAPSTTSQVDMDDLPF